MNHFWIVKSKTNCYPIAILQKSKTNCLCILKHCFYKFVRESWCNISTSSPAKMHVWTSLKSCFGVPSGSRYVLQCDCIRSTLQIWNDYVADIDLHKACWYLIVTYYEAHATFTLSDKAERECKNLTFPSYTAFWWLLNVSALEVSRRVFLGLLSICVRTARGKYI